MEITLHCPKCGHALPMALPDKPLPPGWTIHHAATCGACGHVLRFEDGGMPVIEVTMLHTRSVLVDGQAKTLHAGQVYTLPADVALDLLSMGTAKRTPWQLGEERSPEKPTLPDWHNAAKASRL